MARNFVALDDPVHHLLREVTRSTPLGGGDPDEEVRYQGNPEALPDGYFALAWFHSLGGFPVTGDIPRWHAPLGRRPWVCERVGWFDAVRLDRRCCRDLRLQLDPEGRRMVSADLLAFGIGVLRARNDHPEEPVHQYLRRRYGVLHSRYETVLARLHTLVPSSVATTPVLQKEAYDSTNLIYGDAFGELEQLWERRADTAFLDQVARSLQGARRRGYFAGFVHPPLHLPALRNFHLRAQSVWKTPPATARSLLRRIEYILNRTVVDTSPVVVIETEKPRRETPAKPESPPEQWQSDTSGYDGWLGNSR